MSKEHQSVPTGHIGLNEAQILAERWRTPVVGEKTPQQTIYRFKDEVRELDELIDGRTPQEIDALIATDEGFRKALGKEAGDVMFTSLGVLHSLGLDAEGMFYSIMMINYQKYSLQRITELVEAGADQGQAIKIAKQEWDAQFPKDQWGNHQL